jgi:hypothetical protein
MNNLWKVIFSVSIHLLAGRLSAQTRLIRGHITDRATGDDLRNASIFYTEGHQGTRADSSGRFELTVGEGKVSLVISMVDYTTEKIVVPAGKSDTILVALAPQIQNLSLVVVSNKHGKYRNKNNPAVELIRQVIANKDSNRAAAVEFSSYREYEKVELSLLGIPFKNPDSRLAKPYQFLFEHPDTSEGDTTKLYPVYLEEQLSDVHHRKDPARTSRSLVAEKKVDFGDLVDTKGISNYMHALFTDIDIYDNNIFLFTNQFLSPIANAAPTYYEFFLGDTVLVKGERLVRLNFLPRNPDDLLFRGYLYVSLDGRYSVERVYLTISQKINLNFIKNLHILEEFEKTDDGRYYLVSSDAAANFSFTGGKKGIHGRKYVNFSGLVTGVPIPDSVFNAADAARDTAGAQSRSDAYWENHRPIPLMQGEARVYGNIDSLSHLHAFIRAKDLVNLLAAGYKSAGKFEIGPANAFYSFNSVEGFRLRFGGRSTPKFSDRVYLDGYGAYGFTDHRWKYDAGVAYSFNKVPTFGYPLHYLKAEFTRDMKIPGQELQSITENSFLLSFKRGKDDKWLYNDIFKLNYKQELSNHLSYDLGFKYWKQAPAGSIYYLQPKGSGYDSLRNIRVSQFSALIRWAPHEKFYQGRVYRVPFTNQYPILTFQYIGAVKNLFGSNYSYQNLNLNIFKRFYLSTFGYTNVTLSGGYIAGKLPFPLLQIAPANQTYAYQPDSYNLMNFLEFVSDHYTGLDVEHHFNGFIFNKIPLLKRLKWREIIEAKLLYGGLRPENDPSHDPALMRFPFADHQNTTFALGNQPYLEGGVAIGNIFKFLRVDAIERFSYLSHLLVPRYGIRFQLFFDY